jgi:hypothetical protein
MIGIREFLKTSGGKIAAIALVLIGLVAAFLSLRDNVGPGEAAAMSRDRIFICAETGKPFEYSIRAGDKIPVYSPHSKKNTGYQAELCFWTADGQPKADPTPVLLNQYAGQPGPTFCPDCSRLVTAYNPGAMPGQAPPPTKAQYGKRSPGQEVE